MVALEVCQGEGKGDSSVAAPYELDGETGVESLAEEVQRLERRSAGDGESFRQAGRASNAGRRETPS